jgi:hypothetical protein
MLSWSIVYETSYTLPGHAGRILGLCSWWHHLDNDPDAVVFAIMIQSGYSAGGGRADGEAVGSRKTGPVAHCFRLTTTRSMTDG